MHGGANIRGVPGHTTARSVFTGHVATLMAENNDLRAEIGALRAKLAEVVARMEAAVDALAATLLTDSDSDATLVEWAEGVLLDLDDA